MGSQRVRHDWATFTITLCPFGLSRWLSGKESTCQRRRPRRCGFDPWVGKIPWRKWQPTPVFLAGESYRQRSLIGLQRVRHDRATEHAWMLCPFDTPSVFEQLPCCQARDIPGSPASSPGLKLGISHFPRETVLCPVLSTERKKCLCETELYSSEVKRGETEGRRKGNFNILVSPLPWIIFFYPYA